MNELILTVARAGMGHKGLLSLYSRNNYKRGDGRVTKERSIDPDLMYKKLIHCEICQALITMADSYSHRREL